MFFSLNSSSNWLVVIVNNFSYKFGAFEAFLWFASCDPCSKYSMDFFACNWNVLVKTTSRNLALLVNISVVTDDDVDSICRKTQFFRWKSRKTQTCTSRKSRSIKLESTRCTWRYINSSDSYCGMIEQKRRMAFRNVLASHCFRFTESTFEKFSMAAQLIDKCSLVVALRSTCSQWLMPFNGDVHLITSTSVRVRQIFILNAIGLRPFEWK